jgi:hypothetical protein
MASGLVCRTDRPNTWLHDQDCCKREESSCQFGAVHTWHKGRHWSARTLNGSIVNDQYRTSGLIGV